MRWFDMLRFRARAIFRRPSLDHEMEAEMHEHLLQETENLIARGMTPGEASARARQTMGSLRLIQEECRDARGISWWEHFRSDVSFALHILSKRRSFSLVAVLTMAFGIGSVSAVYSIFDTLLLRPLPYPNAERLVSISGINMRGPFDELRNSSREAAYAGHQGVRSFNLLAERSVAPERIQGAEVSANLFEVLGIPAFRGRVFTEGEDRPGRKPVVILGYSFWKERFGAREDVLGQQLLLDEISYEVVGVMPPSFRYPAPSAQVWTPLLLDPRNVGEYWGSAGTAMLARLRPGSTITSFEAELRASIPEIRRKFPWRMPDAWGSQPQVQELLSAEVADVRTRSWTLLGAVSLVLLIAVVNVAMLVVGHTKSRLQELSARTLLGATPGRLARQLLTESLVLALVGGIAGVLLGYGLLPMLLWLLPADTPRLAEVSMDGRVLGFAAIVTIASAVLVGLWPACWMYGSQGRCVRLTKERSGTGNRRSLRGDAALVVMEAAFATLLVVAAGLLLRSLWSMSQMDPGFQADALVTAELSPSPSTVDTAGERLSLWKAVHDRLASYPGVRGVAASNRLPFSSQTSAFAASVEGHPIPAEQAQYVLWSTAITPEYRDVFGIQLVHGRNFGAEDQPTTAPVAMVSRSTAERFWPGENPIGKHVKPFHAKEWRTIVGVLSDVKSFGFNPAPSWIHGEVYLPSAQAFAIREPLSLALRIDGDPGSIERALPTLVQEVCSTCAVSKIATMQQVIHQAAEGSRSLAWLVAGFALLALGIASAGIYGVVNHGVLRRRRELGVRLALGANRMRVAMQVTGSSVKAVLVGSAVGLTLAALLTTLIRNLLFGIPPHDLLSFVAGPAVLVAAAILASLLPARRAARIDPAETLRES